jgi:hypothetical protein
MALQFNKLKNNAIDLCKNYNEAKVAWIALKSGKSPGVGHTSAY